METREELLNGLNDARTIIKQLANIQANLNQVRSRYKKPLPTKGIGKLAIIILAIFGIRIVVGLFNFSVGDIIFGALGFALVFLVIKYINKKKNEKIDAENQKIAAENENVKAQEQAVLNELQNVQIAYRDRVGYWYPNSYCSVDAVEFFYNLVSNYRADSLKEAINIYETTLHQQRVEDNQKKAVEQQKLNNLLSAGSLVMQGLSYGEQSRHNAYIEEEIEREKNNYYNRY